MSNIIWYANVTNSVGKRVDLFNCERLKDAVKIVAESNGGYVERQEWCENGASVKSQLIVSIVNFAPSAGEQAAIEDRITVPFPELDLMPAHWRNNNV